MSRIKFKIALTISAVIIVFQMLLSGCAVVPRITDATIIRIYADEKANPKEFPVIFIPGMFGTVLEDTKTGKVIWGKVSEGLIKELALPIESTRMSENTDEVMPVKTLTKFSWIPGLIEKDIYEKMRRIAVDAAGYEIGKNAFSLTYDWRRDLVEGAERLGGLIDEIKLNTGRKDLKFDIVCHSAGGLIARYYAKYGTEDVLDRDSLPEPTYAGAKNINKIIMLGTPNRGSIESFECMHKGLTIPGIGYTTKETIFSMPSAYELMPFGENTVFIDFKGETLPINLYDPLNWEEYGWSVFADKAPSEEVRATERKFLAAILKRAAAFQKALWAGDPREERRKVTYILLGSDANPTKDKALLKKTASGWQTQFKPNDDTIKDKIFVPGDGSVTRKSLLGTHIVKGIKEELPSAYEIFFAQYHIDLTGDPTFLDNILHSLLDKENDWKSIRNTERAKKAQISDIM